MGKLTAKPRTAIVNGQITTTSRILADTFGKRHDDVLKRIRALDCSQEFHLRNFAEVFYTVEAGNGAQAQYKEFRITRDGFMFLTMGFTGKEAAARKEAWIDTFNAMAAKLAEKQQKQALSHTKRARSATKSVAPAPLMIGLDPAAAIGAGIPEVPGDVDIPRDLVEAIDSRAMTMASESLPAFRSYLRRAMVQQSLVGGYLKPARIDAHRARHALAAASLPNALAYEAQHALKIVSVLINQAHQFTSELHQKWGAAQA